MGGDGGDNLTNVQCKAICNCHNEYMLIKMKKVSVEQARHGSTCL
jgi:hypothetical protein